MICFLWIRSLLLIELRPINFHFITLALCVTCLRAFVALFIAEFTCLRRMVTTASPTLLCNRTVVIGLGYPCSSHCQWFWHLLLKLMNIVRRIIMRFPNFLDLFYISLCDFHRCCNVHCIAKSQLGRSQWFSLDVDICKSDDQPISQHVH